MFAEVRFSINQIFDFVRLNLGEAGHQKQLLLTCYYYIHYYTMSVVSVRKIYKEYLIDELTN